MQSSVVTLSIKTRLMFKYSGKKEERMIYSSAINDDIL